MTAMTYGDAVDEIQKKFPEFEIIHSGELDTHFVFSMGKNGVDSFGGVYGVSKDTGKLDLDFAYMPRLDEIQSAFAASEPTAMKTVAHTATGYILVDDETLMHYGVPGMKWGVRKKIATGAQRVGSAMARHHAIRKAYRKSTTAAYRHEHKNVVARVLTGGGHIGAAIRSGSEARQIRKAYKKVSKSGEYKRAVKQAAKHKTTLNKGYIESKALLPGSQRKGEAAVLTAKAAMSSRQTKRISKQGEQMVNEYIAKDIRRYSKGRV